MEPWLGKRPVSSGKDALLLSPKTEMTLSELAKVTDGFLQTMRDDFWHDPYVSALPYYFSIVPTIQIAKNAYPFFCGRIPNKDAIAVSISINPDFIMGLKDPLLRYAKAMPAIAQSTPNFANSAEYSLFIFCYRTLIFVLEELLLAVPKIDVRESFAALYELDSSFEALRLAFLRCGSSDGKKAKQISDCPDIETFQGVANRCIDALRNVSKEFYIVEMLLQKQKNGKSSTRMEKRRNAKSPESNLDKRELNDFLQKLSSHNNSLIV